MNPQAEGANPSPSTADRTDQMPRAADQMPRADADANAAATSPGEENKGKPPVRTE